MPDYSIIQTNFASGELTEKLHARVDIANYQNGAAKLENYIVFPQGGVEKRPGTKFINEVKDSSKNTRLIRFIFSTTQAYMIEFGDLYVRFYKDEGVITSGGPAVEVVTPYTASDIDSLYFTQSADVIYLFHPNYAPRKLSRTSHTSWTLTTIDFIDGPWLAINTTATTLTPSGTTGAITLAASANLFAATDVGRLVRIQHAGNWGSAKITGYTSPTLVNATVQTNTPFFGTTAVANWRLGVFSDTLGWPAVGTFHDQSLYLSNTISFPQTFWRSVINDFERFSPTLRVGSATDAITDDSGFSFTLATDQVNAILWMNSGKVLTLGTTDAEFTISPSNLDEAITPTNIRARRETSNGSKKIRPARIANSIIYVHRSGRKILDYAYSFQSDGYQVADLTVFADHVTKKGVKNIVFCQQPYNLIWVLMDNGDLNCLTYLPEQKIVAWHRHPIAGQNRKVLSIEVIPSMDGTFDQLWMIVERTINGVTKKYVEILTKNFDPVDSSDKDNCFFVDAGLTYDNPKTITNITQANPAVVTSAGHTFANGDTIKLTDIVGMTDLNRESVKIANVTANTFELQGVNSTGFSAYVSGGKARKKVTTISGLSHLEGQTVTILADGATHPDTVVSGGAVTLTRSAAVVQIGLGYLAKGSTLPVDISQGNITSMSKDKKPTRVAIRMLNSLGLKVGPTFDHLDTVPFRTSSDPMGESPALFTGMQYVAFPSGTRKLLSVCFVQDLPLPSTVLALVLDTYVG